MSEVCDRLRRARGTYPPALTPAFDWALHEAVEADYRAAVASDAVQSGIPPVYPTIVRLLANAGREGDHDA